MQPKNRFNSIVPALTCVTLLLTEFASANVGTGPAVNLFTPVSIESLSETSGVHANWSLPLSRSFRSWRHKLICMRRQIVQSPMTMDVRN